jgi:hypothetical protein
MLHSLLFPYRARYVGWLIFIPAAIWGIVALNWEALTNNSAFNINFNDFGDEVAGVSVIVGLLLVAFSRERIEDEMIGRMRLEALQWSVYANYLILIVAILTMYEYAFFNVMIYNMFTLLLVFIARMRWLMYKNTHQPLEPLSL